MASDWVVSSPSSISSLDFKWVIRNIDEAMNKSLKENRGQILSPTFQVPGATDLFRLRIQEERSFYGQRVYRNPVEHYEQKMAVKWYLSVSLVPLRQGEQSLQLAGSLRMATLYNSKDNTIYETDPYMKTTEGKFGDVVKRKFTSNPVKWTFKTALTFSNDKRGGEALKSGRFSFVEPLKINSPESESESESESDEAIEIRMEYPDIKITGVIDTLHHKEKEPMLKSLLANPQYSDLSLTCGDRTFPCHRAILSCRSDVFARMLESNMKEAQSGVVNITELEPEVLERVIEFIYTDRVEEGWAGGRGPGLVNQLLYAADKYNLRGLVGYRVEF